MLGKDIIDFITERKLVYRDVIINFSYKNNGAYVLDIKSINSDADDENIVLNIGEIDNILSDTKNKIGIMVDKSKATETFNCDETPFPKESRLNPKK
jgi:hypothetical protein